MQAVATLVIPDSVRPAAVSASSPSPAASHLLPCTIHYNGEAKVSRYFESRIMGENSANVSGSHQNRDPTEEQSGKPPGNGESTGWRVHFRGRELSGTVKRVPNGYLGLLISPSRGQGGAMSDSQSSTTSSSSCSGDRMESSENEGLSVVELEAGSSFTAYCDWKFNPADARSRDQLSHRIHEWISISKAIHQPVPAE